MATIYDIAKAVGCNSSTVSRALNGTRRVNPELKEKILKVAKEMNYVTNVTARNLISNQSYSIGIIYHESLEIGLEHQHFGAILQSFKTYVEKEGYDITFVSRKIGKQSQTYLEWCKSRKIAGVLIVTVDHRDEQLVELIESDIPVVSVNKVDLDCSTIISDNISGTEKVMDYFFTKNIKDVAHISLPSTSYSGKERRETYLKYMEQNNSMLVFSDGYSYENGYEAMNKLLKQCDVLPKGIYVATDMLAIGAINALLKAGYNIPYDIEVIGFDNVEMSKYITPSLTTVNQNQHEIGKEAAQVLISFIVDKEKKRNDLLIKIPVQLIQRDSTYN